MNDKDATRPKVMLRLADLYAERARLESMSETAQSGESGDKSASDRKRALSLYRAALPQASRDQKGEVILQMTHLCELLGDREQAVKLYETVLREKTISYSNDIKADAHMGLGENFSAK